MKRFERLARNEGGFTLIELILVTVIIAILAGMVTLSFRGTGTDTRIRAALGDVKSYESAIELFALENNDRFPETLQELVTGKKEYIRDLNKDPWGNDYIYLNPGVYHKNSYDIFSMGPDGVRDTEDDVAPWLMDEDDN